MDQIGALVSSVGFPIAALIGLAISAWRIAGFAAPRVDNWFTRHFMLIDQLTDKLVKIDTLPKVVESHGCRLPTAGIDDLVCFAEENREKINHLEKLGEEKRELLDQLDERIKQIELMVGKRIQRQ